MAGNGERKSIRKKDGDYNTGVFFITICTVDRQCVLSQISSDGIHTELLWHGEIADKIIKNLSVFYSHISISSYVIMPNHIHMIIRINKRENAKVSDDNRNTELARFISTFKRFCNKEYGQNIWQRGAFDHIISNKHDYDIHMKNIHENPMKWFYNELNLKVEKI